MSDGPVVWHPVAALSDFGDRAVIPGRAGERDLALYRVAGTVYATQARCTHQDVALAGGEVVEGYIECPAHYGLFEIATGRAQGAPVCRDLVTYPVRVEDGRILVALAD
jgi:nitrite reductase/ring-hydroxylating ferredoxin subunit